MGEGPLLRTRLSKDKKKAREKDRLLAAIELWLRLDRRRRAVYWLIYPLLSIPILHVLGWMDEANVWMPLFWALFVSLLMGILCDRFGATAFEAPFAGSWVPLLMAWRKTYWVVGRPSPAGAAQSLMGWLGWRYAGSLEALASVLCAAGLFGYLASFVDRRINGRYSAGKKLEELAKGIAEEE